uniref:Uncharacterized protein n=1 Tax=Timema poppense TaxID=170557 RepID=A0A7R9HAC7_TIMPO|nr:unnamed protein product [Timema poppensis]
MLSFGNLLVTGTRHCACPASPRRRLTCQSSRALSVLFSRVSESSSGGFEPLFPAGPVDRRMQLTPAFAAMILLQVGVLPRLGSGPMFGGMYNKTINACDQYWWAALLYFHNFLKPKNMVKPGTFLDMRLSQTWYLSLDMQLYLLSPLILIPLWKKPKFGLYLLGFLMVLGPSISFAIAYTHQLLPTFFEIAPPQSPDPTPLLPLRYFLNSHLEISNFKIDILIWRLEDARNGELFAYYTPPVRFTPWILGIFLGYVLHKTKNHKPLLSKPVVIVGWVGNILMMLAAQYLIYPIQQPDYVYDRLVCSFYFALFRTCWALGVAWIVFACVTGYGGRTKTWPQSSKNYQHETKQSDTNENINLPEL